MVERLRVLIKAGRYRVTLHAEQERDADQILTSEIEEAFTDRESVVLKITRMIHEDIRPLC